MSGGAGSAVDGLKNTLGQMDTMMEKSLSGFASRQEAIQQMNATLMEDLKTGLSNAMSAMTTEMGDASKAAADTLRASGTDTRNKIQQSLENLATGMGALGTRLDESIERMSHRADKSVENIAEATNRATSDWNKRMESASQTVATRLTEAADLSRSQLIEGASEASDRMRASAAQINEATQNLRSALALFGKSTSELSPVISDIAAYQKTQAEALDRVHVLSGTLSTMTNTFEHAAKMQEKTAAGIGDTVEELRTFVESVETSTSSLNENSDSMRKTWEDYRGRFENVDHALEKVMEAINTGVESYTTKVREFHQEIDKFSGKAITTLSSAVNELEGTLENLDGRLR